MMNDQLQRPLLDEVDHQIIHQRNQDMTKIVTDLDDLKQTMNQINELVREQQVDLDATEINTTSADAHVEAAVTEITVASQYQQSYRKKICIIIVIVAIVLIGILLIILWKTGVFNPKDALPPAEPAAPVPAPAPTPV